MAHGAWRMAHGAWRMAHGNEVFETCFRRSGNEHGYNPGGPCSEVEMSVKTEGRTFKKKVDFF
jgi:hypothetical protein